MKSDKELTDIVWDIYRDMYLLAEPPADFDELAASGGEFYLNHLISKSDYNAVIKNNLKGKRLKDYEKTKIINTIALGCSPKFK